MSQSNVTRKAAVGRRTKAANKIIYDSQKVDEEKNVRQSQRQRKRKVHLGEEDVEVSVPKKLVLLKLKNQLLLQVLFDKVFHETVNLYLDKCFLLPAYYY